MFWCAAVLVLLLVLVCVPSLLYVNLRTNHECVLYCVCYPVYHVHLFMFSPFTMSNEAGRELFTFEPRSESGYFYPNTTLVSEQSVDS